MPRTLTFCYSVPVLVTVDLDEKTVTEVHVDDETPLSNEVNLVDGDESAEVEPDQDRGWCENCREGFIVAAPVLAGII